MFLQPEDVSSESKPPSDIDPWIEGLAQRIVRFGLTAPAIAFLELHKPLAGVFASSAIVLQPSVALLFGFANAKRVVALCEDRESLEKLIQAIERAAKGEGATEHAA